MELFAPRALTGGRGASRPTASYEAKGRIVCTVPDKSEHGRARRRRKRDERLRPTQRAVTPAGGGAPPGSRRCNVQGR
jgi:hypothetical protein